jgi:hypothetical protein
MESQSEVIGGSLEVLRGLNARAHHKGICGVVGKLLVLNNIAFAEKNSARHRMDYAWLVLTLKGCDEIHALSLRETSE